MIRYKSKCKLVKGWNDLIDKVDEDLNTLISMKISPYYKAFEEEILPTHEKLEKIRIIIDVWLDVQKNWIYLENIFFGSSEIKQRL